MIGSIENQALHEHRAKLVTTGLRGFWTGLPVFAATLYGWDPSLWLLALFSGVVMCAAGYSSFRGMQELALPLRERFELEPEGEVLVRYVGDVEHTRIPRAKVKALFMDKDNLMIGGGRKQIIIPRTIENFPAFEETIRLWQTVHTRREMFGKFGTVGLIRIVIYGVLVLVALLYMTWVIGIWQLAVLGASAGIVIAEVMRRVIIGRSLARVPSAG